MCPHILTKPTVDLMIGRIWSYMPNDSLTIRVTDFIFDYIRNKGLSTGEALPSEMRTSTELNISRGIVREAFRSLEVAGIIEKENGRSPHLARWLTLTAKRKVT